MSGSPNATAHVEPLLEAYHAGALPPEEVARVERHLRACAACREQSEAIAVYQIIRSAPAPTVGPALRQRLYTRIAEAERADARAASAASHARLRARFASNTGPAARSHGVLARGGWLSGAAAALIVALLVGMFWALPHIRQGGKRATHPTTPITACPASKTTADLPANLTLSDLAMTSTTDGWAVGEIENANGQPSQGVILRYSDCRWSRVALDLKDVSLTHISMDSSTDGWASGQWNFGSANYNSQGLILLHYTGGAWGIVPVSQRPANHGMVFALSMRAPDDGWLLTSGPDEFTNGNGLISVGVARLWHYQQGAWTQVAPCPIQMPGVIVPAGLDDLWVAGSSFTGPYKEQAQYLAHYHDGAWTQVASPGGLQVLSLRAVSPSDIWASGMYGSGFGAVAHYDGVAWQMAPGAVSALPTPALTPGAALAPTDPTNPVLHGGEFSGIVYITGDGAGWAYDWKSPDNAPPESEALIANVYREDGGGWQSLNWPYSDVGSITTWTTLPDGEVWATGNRRTIGTELTPLPGGGGTSRMSFTTYLLHYANGAWSRYITSSHTAS